MSTLIPPPLQRLRTAVVHARPASQDNTLHGSRQNIQRHYDLSNDLFELFLDPSLTYSSALFDTDPQHSDEQLLTAQHRKIERLLDATGVTAGSSVLEIGTGWGELSIRAAARGARVTTVTISVEQAELATKRIAEAGYADRVEVRLQDYREVTGSFDCHRQRRDDRGGRRQPLARVLRRLERLLAPGGRAGAAGHHDAARPDDRQPEHLHLDPEVHLPRRPTALGAVGARSPRPRPGSRSATEFGFGPHYAETLRRWRARLRRGRRPRCASCHRLRPRSSAGCGRSTWPTPRPASGPGTSTWCSSA